MNYVFHMINVFAMYAVLGVSLNILFGYSGLLSLSHAAMFALGAYGSALVAVHLGANFFVATLAGILIAVLISVMVSIPASRVKDEYLVILTLAIQMIIFGLLRTSVDVTGGTYGMSTPKAELFGLQLRGPASYLPLILVFSGLCIALSWWVTHSPFGRVLKAMRDDEIATLSLGKNIFRFKVLVFIIAGGIAAVAGSLFASYMPLIAPSSFSLSESIFMLAIVIVGGRANIWGSVVGAFLLVMIPEVLKFLPGTGMQLGTIRMGIYGAMLILFIRFRPQGILPEYMRIRARVPASVALSPEEEEDILRRGIKPYPQEAQHNPEVTLKVEGLCKNFGGVRAMDNVSLTLPKGKITALVGPNGAGKTTLFNLVTGFLKADTGTVYFQGRDITKFSPHKIVHLGMTRSFQEVRVFHDMTVLDNVLLACPRQSGENLGLLFFCPWRVAKEEKENFRRAVAYLDFVGLAEKTQEMAKNLSFAEQKLLTLASLLATGSDVLLLDEVVSGVDAASIDRELALIRRLAGWGKTICIIEHNMDVVRDVADSIYFLAEGRLIATGAPSELMADRELKEIYFGT